jgi:hypothetical protein
MLPGKPDWLPTEAAEWKIDIPMFVKEAVFDGSDKRTALRPNLSLPQ